MLHTPVYNNPCLAPTRIEDLPLIERESIIAQRRDEVLSRERAAQLAGMVAAQQGRSRASKRSSSTVRSKPAKRRKAAKAESDMDEDSDEDEDEDEEDEDESDDSQGAATSKSRSGRIRKSVGTSDTRNKKLQELSENRRKKASRSALRAGKSSDEDGASPRKAAKGKRSSSDSDAETEDSDVYVDSEDEAERRRGLRGAAAAGTRAGRTRARDTGPFVPPEVEDLNKARIGREDILKIMYRKGWEDMLVGKFVRVTAEPKRDERTGQIIPRYRAYEVVDWKQGLKWYQVDTGKYTRVVLILAFAKEKHQKQISFVSNSEITAEEHQRYSWQAQESSSRPSKADVLYQAEEWSDFANEPWTEEVFTEVLKERKAAKAAAEAEGAGGPGSANGDGRSRGPSGISTPNAAGSGHANGTSTPTGGNSQKTENELLAELNERNRKLDRVRIQEAEKRQAEARRAAALAAAAAAARKDTAVNGQGSGSSASGNAAQGASPSANGYANGGGDANDSHVSSTKAESSSVDVDIDLGDF